MLTNRQDDYYNPEANIDPNWRYIHEDRCFDFKNTEPDDSEPDGWEDGDFRNIEIDISDGLLELLIKKATGYIESKCRPCSFDIWCQKSIEIEDIKDLHNLIGECLVNDDLVEAIVAGCNAVMDDYQLESYYTP